MKKGFTLLETLVGITILTIAVAGPFYAASRAIIAVNLSGQTLTASYLAQEGVEYVQAMRSSTFLVGAVPPGFTPTGDCPATMTLSEAAYCHFTKDDSVTLASSIKDCLGGGGTKCMFDPGKSMGIGVGKALQVCGTTCSRLNLVSGRYSLDSGTVTPFTREIQVYDLAGTGEALEVVVRVKWQSYGAQEAVARGYLSGWQ